MKVLQYFKDLIGELKRVSWPTKKETVNYVVVVILISFVVGMYLGLVDWLVTNFLQRFIM